MHVHNLHTMPVQPDHTNCNVQSKITLCVPLRPCLFPLTYLRTGQSRITDPKSVGARRIVTACSHRCITLVCPEKTETLNHAPAWAGSHVAGRLSRNPD